MSRFLSDWILYCNMLPVGPTVKGADVALKCLTDDSNFIRESSKRKTIFKDMFVSGEAFIAFN